MKEIVFLLCSVIIVILFFAVVIIITDKTVGWYYKNQDKKRRKEHPELYRLFDAIDEKAGECCRWSNEQIYPKKKEIDNILKDWNYYTDERKVQKEAELKRLREDIQTAEVVDKVLHNELVELREQTKEYIEKHNIKWAKKMGWN